MDTSPVGEAESVLDDSTSAPENGSQNPAENIGVFPPVENSEGFDPSIHAVNADGTPKRRGNGSLALKRGPKRAGTTGAQGPLGAPRPTVRDVPNAPGVPQMFSGAQAVQITNKEAAKQICNLVISAMVVTVGEEWQPASKDEADALVLGVKNYFDAKGQMTLSPEWGLVAAVLGYTVPRLYHPNTKSKLATAISFAKAKILGVFRATKK